MQTTRVCVKQNLQRRLATGRRRISFVSVRYDRITVGHALLLELEDSWSLETRFVQVEVLLFIKVSGPISEENPDLGQLSNSRLQKLQIFNS